MLVFISTGDIKFMSKMQDILLYLKNPDLVYHFQNYFGVVRAHDENHDLKCKCKKPAVLPKSRESNGIKHHENGFAHLINHHRDCSNCSSIVSDTEDSENDKIQKSSKNEQNYKITNWFWYYLFSFGASLGYEIFYSTFFPFLFWNIDNFIGWKVIIVWVLVMYIGQALKDVIKWPRPSSPPVVQLEPHYSVEYGMPSTHAMVSVAVPFSLLVFSVSKYEYPLETGVLVACVWCILVCGSRLYMGMHTVLDVLAGLALVLPLLVILIPLTNLVELSYVVCDIYFPVALLLGLILLAWLYPVSPHWTPARGDTTVIVGTGSGTLIGHWINIQFNLTESNHYNNLSRIPVLLPSILNIGLSFLRLFIGLLFILASRFICKTLFRFILCKLIGLDQHDPRSKNHPWLEIPTKFITYLFIGIVMTYFVPIVFHFLHISKPTIFIEA